MILPFFFRSVLPVSSSGDISRVGKLTGLPSHWQRELIWEGKLTGLRSQSQREWIWVGKLAGLPSH